MKKEKQTEKIEFSVGKLNAIIGSLNKTTLTLIIGVYICLLTLVLALIGKNLTYANEPEWQHQFYAEELTPQLSITGVYDPSAPGSVSRYGVSVTTSRREKTGDAPYRINSFRMFVNTKKELNAAKVSGTYYFTEQTGRDLARSVTHTYYLDNTQKAQHPADFYLRLEYAKKGSDATRIATFKESVFLAPSEKDIKAMDLWLEGNPNKSATVIEGAHSGEKGTFQVAAFQDTDADRRHFYYEGNVKIELTDPNIEKYHIDMQTWVVTADGSYLPFIGVYGLTSESKKYTNYFSRIEGVNPKYIAGKLIYWDEDGSETPSYFKQDIDAIQSAFAGSPDAGTLPEKEKNYRGLYISLIAAGSVLFGGILLGAVYLINKKKRSRRQAHENAAEAKSEKRKKKIS